MSRLIESIRLHNGVFSNLDFHQWRMDHSVEEVFGVQNTIDLQNELATHRYPRKGLFKCRVIYDTSIAHIEWIPYVPKPVQQLKIVISDDIHYPHKFEDRSAIEDLMMQREQCDDIIIVKNNLITDSSYSNLIFSDGKQWITPKSPLLKGTMRHYLLEAGAINLMEMTLEDLKWMRLCKLINAMVGWEGPELSVSRIVF